MPLQDRECDEGWPGPSGFSRHDVRPRWFLLGVTPTTPSRRRQGHPWAGPPMWSVDSVSKKGVGGDTAKGKLLLVGWVKTNFFPWPS